MALLDGAPSSEALSGPRGDQLRQLAALLDVAPAGVLMRDARSRITYWNRGAERLYGYPADRARGRVSHDLLRTVFPHSREAADEALDAEGYWAGELTHTRSDAAPSSWTASSRCTATTKAGRSRSSRSTATSPSASGRPRWRSASSR